MHDALRAHLDRTLPDDDAPLAAFADLDLGAFLAATSNVPLPDHERLRQLGIFLEEDRRLPDRHGAAAWPVLDRVHAEAVRRGPEDDATWSSRAAAALACAEAADRDPALLEEAVRLQRSTLARFPDDAHASYLLGTILYAWDEPRRLEEALAAYRRSAELDPTYGWPRLYVAHALHDLQRWEEAAAAYAAVPTAAFDDESCSWRMPLAREQRADCLLRAGHRDAAVALFGEVLDGIEAAIARGADPFDDALFIPPWLLTKAAEGELRAELGERVAAMERALDAAHEE